MKKVHIIETKDNMSYVHFDLQDHRLDQWIANDEINTQHSTASIANNSDLKLKIKNVNRIQIGPHLCDVWYASPLPREFNLDVYDCLYFCEFCLSFFAFESELAHHNSHCVYYHPPGNEIYRSKEANCTINVFEVDGAKQKVFCENLCVLSKMFLDDKQMRWDTDIFYFYVLCEVLEIGCRFVGYFSREKNPEAEAFFNLACIMVLPAYQRHGYGLFLISLSYVLSVAEEIPGSPEKPLSDLGKSAFENYWLEVILEILKNSRQRLSITNISQMTGIITSDVVETVKPLLRSLHGESVFDISGVEQTNHIKIRADISKLRWAPFTKKGKRL